MARDPSPETLTFVLTDLESSTRLWERFPDAMEEAVERHDAILRDAVEGSGGRVVKGTGDGLMAVFDVAVDGGRLRASPRSGDLHARGVGRDRPAARPDGRSTPARRSSGRATSTARP